MADAISVIVPVYNNAGDLPRCLDSILAQTYPHMEIIAVNDGSSDESGGILDHYAAEHPNVRVIHKENGGVTSARLCGVAEASGQWIGFVDGDDAIEPDMYGRLLRNAQKHGADISHCGYQMVFPDGRVNYFHNTGAVEVHDRLTALRELLSGERIEPGLCNKLFRKRLFHGWEMPGEIRINEDLLMNIHLFCAAEISVFDDWCPYHYIVRQGSASRQKLNHHKIYDPIRVKEHILKIAPAEVLDSARRAYLSTCISVYNSIVLAGQAGLEEDRANVRQLIVQHFSWTNLLSGKQKLLANLIRYIPWAYKPIYGFYAAHVQKNPYS